MSEKSDYSLYAYRLLMTGLLSADYRFVGFGEALSQEQEKRRCLLRHDVDADLHAAYTLAKEEAALGIRSTYFLMLRSPAYNLLARHNQNFVEQILSLGHWIGLHYDRGFCPHHGRGHSYWMEREAEILENLFGVRVEALSFHQPDTDVLTGAVTTGKRINTYDRQALRGYQYFSDSNRTLKLRVQGWDGGRESVHLDELGGSNIQLLLHPMWWVYHEATTSEVWDRTIKTNFELSQSQYLATERAYGGRRDMHLVTRST